MILGGFTHDGPAYDGPYSSGEGPRINFRGRVKEIVLGIASGLSTGLYVDNGLRYRLKAQVTLDSVTNVACGYKILRAIISAIAIGRKMIPLGTERYRPTVAVDNAIKGPLAIKAPVILCHKPGLSIGERGKPAFIRRLYLSLISLRGLGKRGVTALEEAVYNKRVALAGCTVALKNFGFSVDSYVRFSVRIRVGHRSHLQCGCMI